MISDHHDPWCKIHPIDRNQVVQLGMILMLPTVLASVSLDACVIWVKI